MKCPRCEAELTMAAQLVRAGQTEGEIYRFEWWQCDSCGARFHALAIEEPVWAYRNYFGVYAEAEEWDAGLATARLCPAAEDIACVCQAHDEMAYALSGKKAWHEFTH